MNHAAPKVTIDLAEYKELLKFKEDLFGGEKKKKEHCLVRERKRDILSMPLKDCDLSETSIAALVFFNLKTIGDLVSCDLKTLSELSNLRCGVLTELLNLLLRHDLKLAKKE